MFVREGGVFRANLRYFHTTVKFEAQSAGLFFTEKLSYCTVLYWLTGASIIPFGGASVCLAVVFSRCNDAEIDGLTKLIKFFK